MPNAAFASSILTDFFTKHRDRRTPRSAFVCKGEPVPFVPPPVQRGRVRLRLRRRVRFA